jgi:hypothetical protein
MLKSSSQFDNCIAENRTPSFRRCNCTICPFALSVTTTLRELERHRPFDQFDEHEQYEAAIMLITSGGFGLMSKMKPVVPLSSFVS